MPTGRCRSVGARCSRVEERGGLRQHVPVVQDQPVAQLVAEEQVGDDAEVVAQREVLPDHGDALIARAERVRGERTAGDLDGAPVGLIGARDALHDGRLAGAVLADQAEDLTRPHGEVDAAEDLEPAETLVHTPNTQRRQRSSTVAHSAGRLAVQHPPSLPHDRRRRLRVDDRMLLGARPRRLYHAKRGNGIIDLDRHWTDA